MFLYDFICGNGLFANSLTNDTRAVVDHLSFSLHRL